MFKMGNLVMTIRKMDVHKDKENNVKNAKIVYEKKCTNRTSCHTTWKKLKSD
jgi:hypothetical protein